MSKVLYLPLKKDWYLMIESGVKTEEYREIKPYWKDRLTEIVPNYDLGKYVHMPKSSPTLNSLTATPNAL